MSTNYFEFELSFLRDDQPMSGDPLEEFLDCVMDELANIGLDAADLTASLAAGTATFVLPAADISDDTFVETLSTLRTALHAANCGTPGWPTRAEVLGTRSIRDSELTPA